MGEHLCPRPPDAYAALLRELSAIGNNINQIAHWTNGKGYATQAEIHEASQPCKTGIPSDSGHALMAYDKIITIRARLDDCLRYVQDGEKTALSLALDYVEDSDKTALDDEVIFAERDQLHAGNLLSGYARAKERFGKPGGVVGYHLVHSYAPGETTPELAHEAGVEFAQRLLGDKYQAVVLYPCQPKSICIAILYSIPFHSWME